MKDLQYPIEFVDEGADSILLCPVCGNEFTHHHSVHVETRHMGEDSSGLIVSIGPDGLTSVLDTNDEGLYGRRHSLRIDMACEAGHGWSLRIAQHKGQTVFSTELIQVEHQP